MIGTDQIQNVVGATVVDSSGDKIGKAGQVYLDDVTGQPDWVTVVTGLFGTRESFVPLSQADWDGDNLRVPFAKDQVKDAPQVDTDGHLSSEEEAELYRYYGMSDAYASGYTDTTTTTDTTYATTGVTTDGDRDRDGVYDSVEGRTVGYDTSGPTTDEAMTRSEERLEVGVQRVQTGRARLRKHIVTEQETVTVPVSREEVRVVREPITDANIGAATSGPDLSEEEHEVVLTEERAVVDKETVPVERVRLDTETVTENQRITEDVRKEVIETDTDGTGRTVTDGTYTDGTVTRDDDRSLGDKIKDAVTPGDDRR